MGVEGSIGMEGFAQKYEKDIYKDIYEYIERDREGERARERERVREREGAYLGPSDHPPFKREGVNLSFLNSLKKGKL